MLWESRPGGYMAVMKFQSLSIVRLRSPLEPVPDSPDDDAIQQAHMAFLMDLRNRGITFLSGPVKRVDDDRFRGMCIYSVGPDEARKYAMEDPAVKAGWFVLEIDGWIVPAIPTVIGDRVDFEMEV